MDTASDKQWVREPFINEPVFWGVWAAWTAALLLTYFYR